MESILYQLFSGEYDITPKRDKKQQELYDQIFAETDKIEAVFGGGSSLTASSTWTGSGRSSNTSNTTAPAFSWASGSCWRP